MISQEVQANALPKPPHCQSHNTAKASSLPKHCRTRTTAAAEAAIAAAIAAARSSISINSTHCLSSRMQATLALKLHFLLKARKPRKPAKAPTIIGPQVAISIGQQRPVMTVSIQY